MAWRAGCRVSNMEFIQFHPTCLYHPYAKSFLISEAVRGEGGLLKLPGSAATRFMPAHDERAELAPRDVVARAIDFEMKKRGLDCVYLDISHQAGGVPARTLSQHPRALPGAGHRHHAPADSGGAGRALHLRRRAHRPGGRTDMAGLYAIGETACTGLHGANRLASNSLVECMVLRARRGAGASPPAPARRARRALPAWDESRVTDADEAVVISHNWDELRRFMWDYVGIVRTNKRLERAEPPHRAAAGRDPGVLCELPRHARPARTAQPGAGGRADRALGAGRATKAAACISAATILRSPSPPHPRCWCRRTTDSPTRFVFFHQGCPATDARREKPNHVEHHAPNYRHAARFALRHAAGRPPRLHPAGP